MLSSASLLEATGADPDKMTDVAEDRKAIVGLDPVSKFRLTEDEVYARDGDICFQSVATQNFFYKMLEVGYQFENGNFVDSKQVEKVWALRSAKGDFAVLGGSSKNQNLEILIDLRAEGKHVLHAQVADYKDSLAYFSRSKGVVVTVQMVANGDPLGAKMEFNLVPLAETSLKFPFHVPRVSPGPRSIKYQLKVIFHGLHRRRRFILRSWIERTATPKHKLELERARGLSKALVRPDDEEFIVEFEKDAFGLGVSVVWSPEDNAVVVKAIDVDGAAARAGKITKGDIIRAIQGVRVDGMDYREVAKMLRNIPLVAVLILAHPITQA